MKLNNYMVVDHESHDRPHNYMVVDHESHDRPRNYMVTDYGEPCFETDLEELIAFVEKDHSKLYNRDLENQHTIKSIKDLEPTLDTKVDKEDGKELSSNDFTDELKAKLENLGAVTFDIEYPQDKQVLLYNEENDSWANYDLSDENSIIYLDNYGLSLKNYNRAHQGQMLVKDNNKGLYWIDPVSDQSLQEAVELANEAATRSSNYSVQAGNYAASALQSATEAAESVEAVERKFWYGTIDEYNNLEKIYSSTIYIILDE